MSFHKGLIGKSYGGGSVGRVEHTIGDYIQTLEKRNRDKLTFDEWYESWVKTLPPYRGFLNKNDMKLAWKAAQENM